MNEIFPSVLSSLCQIFQCVLDELKDQEVDTNNASYLVKTEGIATMERLAYEMITGDRTK